MESHYSNKTLNKAVIYSKIQQLCYPEHVCSLCSEPGSRLKLEPNLGYKKPVLKTAVKQSKTTVLQGLLSGVEKA